MEFTPYTSMKPQATLIGSFLGGDLLHLEPFDRLVRGSAGVERCRSTLDKLFGITATWYAVGSTRPLGDWRWLFGSAEDGRLLLWGKYDFSKQEDRRKYAPTLSWDVSFVKEEHLSRHWLGKNRDGLLYRLTAGCYVTRREVGLPFVQTKRKESNRIRTVDSSLT